MKTKIYQIFPNKAEAFAWVMEMVQGATIGDVNTDANDCVICETETTIYIGYYA